MSGREPLPLLPLVLGTVPPGLRSALAQEGISACDWAEGPPGGRFVLFDSLTAMPPELAPGQELVDVAPLRAGSGPDPFVALLDRQAARQVWQLGPWRLSEEVARFDKRTLRRRLMEGLRERLESAGGAWVRLCPFPFPYRAALSFRFDHDAFAPADFDAVLQAIAGHEGATSHFICGSTHERHAESLARLRGLDVGSHGYWHHTYHDPRENLRNVRRGIECLTAAGLEPRGFVAPHGRYSPGLAEVLAELGVSHSSEFGLVYDDWPCWSPDGPVLQVPVHPICLGLFLEAARGPAAPTGATPARAAAAAAEHFRSTLAAKYQAGEPAFFYGHPDGRLGRFPQVLSAVWDAAADCGALWATNFSEFQTWWRARGHVALTVWSQGDGLRVEATGRDRAYRWAVEYWRGEHVAVLPFDAPALEFTPAALAYQSRAATPRFTPHRLDASHGLKGQVKRLIDWEKATPVEEIPTDTWPGWVKHHLRRWRG